jgi:dihydropteroate synthase
VARAVRADLAGVTVGDGVPVVIMGVVNVSPESFHSGSVYRSEETIMRAGLEMVEAGAAVIDVGARSTAPYLDTAIDDATETERLARAVELLAAKLPVPISADTSRPGPARAALDAGARIVNDVRTLRDPELARLVAARSAGVIVMASPAPATPAGGPARLAARRSRAHRRHAPRRARAHQQKGAAPLATVRALLTAGLGRARAAGVAERRIVLDPGIGFFRGAGVAWPAWDVRVLAGLGTLRALGRPLAVGVSRKSFIGALLLQPDTSDRLSGSLSATAAAVLAGAALIRTHDVAATRDAVRVAERIRGAGGSRP